ncbi:MAG: hypothetical protein AAGC44_10645 [Planctomycetota bacterium]
MRRSQLTKWALLAFPVAWVSVFFWYGWSSPEHGFPDEVFDPVFGVLIAAFLGTGFGAVFVFPIALIDVIIALIDVIRNRGETDDL